MKKKKKGKLDINKIRRNWTYIFFWRTYEV